MFTCYYCAKTIKGEIKHTGVINAARKTGWLYKTRKAVDLDFAKAFHPHCYAILEQKAKQALSI